MTQHLPYVAGSLARSLVRSDTNPVVRPLTSALLYTTYVSYVSETVEPLDYTMAWQFWGGFDRVLDLDVIIDSVGVIPNAAAYALISTNYPVSGATAEMRTSLPGNGATTRLRISPGTWLTFQCVGTPGGTTFDIRNASDGNKRIFQFVLNVGNPAPP